MFPVAILGIDPGLATLGAAGIGFPLNRDHRPILLEAEVVITKAPKIKRKLRAGDIRADRVRTLTRAVYEIVHRWRPDIIALESGVGGIPNAKSALDLMAGWSAVLAVAELEMLPVIHYTPGDVRKALGLLANASKDDIIAATLKRLDTDAVELLNKIGKTKRQHVSDATALAFVAGKSEVALALLQVERKRESEVPS